MTAHQAPCVVHVATLGDRGTLEALRPTTQVLATRGVSQVLLALDGGRGGDAASWPAPGAEMRRLRCSGLSTVGRIRALQCEFSTLSNEKSLYAVHLHGVEPCLLGSQALTFSALMRRTLKGRILCSPYRSHFGEKWAHGLLRGLLGRVVLPLPYAPPEMDLSDAFFTACRDEEAPCPHILADGTGGEAVRVLTRLCVLLNGRDARVRFSWLGAAEAGRGAQLRAANVTLLDAVDDAARARWLSRAWLYVDMSVRETRRLGLTQAMAAGVPCLVSAVPVHRALVQDGRTGFICASERDLLERVLFLLRDRAARRRLGEAARAAAAQHAAAQRAAAQSFRRAVLRAYGFSGEDTGTEARAPVTT